MTSHFRDDYPIPHLRGSRRLSAHKIKRAMSGRAAYLASTLERRTLLGQPTSYLLDELAAIAQLMELFEERE